MKNLHKLFINRKMKIFVFCVCSIGIHWVFYRKYRNKYIEQNKVNKGSLISIICRL